LRNRGKCVIVVTHDDRYFHLGDRILKLDAPTALGLTRFTTQTAAIQERLYMNGSALASEEIP
jgi:putative ATP-binding cassette transporter